MPTFHLVRVFIGTNGAGGNPLAVFLDGKAIAPDRRLAVTAELGYSESVFVDDIDQGRLAIFVPTSELPFAGHPTVGAAWLLDQIGHPVDRLRVPAGEVPTWREAEWTWVRAQPNWIDFRVNPNFVQLGDAAEVDALPSRHDEPWLYAWAWLDEAAGRLRARSFPTWAGIEEDEASGAAAVLMGGRLGRELLIVQGVGSEIVARPGPDGTVEIAGRCSLAEVGEYVGHGLSQAAAPRPTTECHSRTLSDGDQRTSTRGPGSRNGQDGPFDMVQPALHRYPPSDPSSGSKWIGLLGRWSELHAVPRGATA